MYKKYLPSFVFYFVVGVVAFLIAGLTLRQIIGFGIAFGFVAGLLNEVHRDLVGNVGNIGETIEPIKNEKNVIRQTSVRDNQVQGM